jgi:hypothetical protein
MTAPASTSVGKWFPDATLQNAVADAAASPEAHTQPTGGKFEPRRSLKIPARTAPLNAAAV